MYKVGRLRRVKSQTGGEEEDMTVWRMSKIVVGKEGKGGGKMPVWRREGMRPQFGVEKTEGVRWPIHKYILLLVERVLLKTGSIGYPSTERTIRRRYLLSSPAPSSPHWIQHFVVKGSP